MAREYTEIEQREIHDAFRVWAWTEQASGRLYAADSDWKVVSNLAAQYGAPLAVSAYHRAFRELVEAKAIRPRQIKVAVTIPVTFEAEVNAMSSTELRIKLNRDPAFADLYGRWAAGEKPEGVIESADPYANLTKSQWHALPPNTAARLMSSPQFRAAVDRLVSRGEI